MALALRLAGGIDTIVDLVGRATAWLCLGLALVMGANVLLRYGFSIGSIFMQEFEWHILVPMCVFGMSYALLHGEHVRVDVVFQYFNPRTKLLVEIVTAILGMLLCVLVIRLSIPYVMQSYNIGEGSPNPGGVDHRWIVKSLIPAGFALYFFQSLSEAIKRFAAWREA